MNKEYAEAMKQEKKWCPECKKRCLHEYDPGKVEPNSKLPKGWFCLECFSTNYE